MAGSYFGTPDLLPNAIVSTKSAHVGADSVPKARNGGGPQGGAAVAEGDGED
jgi:hypothetical protein